MIPRKRLPFLQVETKTRQNVLPQISHSLFPRSYQTTLKELFEEGDVDKQQSQLAVATTRIMVVLQQNLDAKSKVYKYPALTQLFMMNNMHYMVRSVKRCARSFSKWSIPIEQMQRLKREPSQSCV
jgi:hypothetical protein